MSELKASRCDACGKVEQCRKHTSHPDDWWLIFGPEGRLDLCSRACVVQHFRPSVAAPTDLARTS